MKALIGLFGITLFLDDLVEVDFQKELSLNKHLASAQNPQKEEVRRIIHDNTIRGAKLLRKRLITSLLWILSACCIAFFVMLLRIKSFCIGSLPTHSSILAFFSIISFSWATLGRLGWEGQTMAGDTVFEQLDYFIFWCLYWLGTLFGTLAFLI
jgi:hypothetical protein